MAACVNSSAFTHVVPRWIATIRLRCWCRIAVLAGQTSYPALTMTAMPLVALLRLVSPAQWTPTAIIRRRSLVHTDLRGDHGGVRQSKLAICWLFQADMHARRQGEGAT